MKTSRWDKYLPKTKEEIRVGKTSHILSRREKKARWEEKLFTKRAKAKARKIKKAQLKTEKKNKELTQKSFNTLFGSWGI